MNTFPGIYPPEAGLNGICLLAGRDRVAMNFYVYVLVSEKDGHFYIGLSSNPQKRLESHNNGEVKSTKGRRPFRLVHQEKASCRAEARSREKFLKSGIGREYLKTIIPR